MCSVRCQRSTSRIEACRCSCHGSFHGLRAGQSSLFGDAVPEPAPRGKVAKLEAENANLRQQVERLQQMLKDRPSVLGREELVANRG